ncbi:MAG: nucleotidyltransferase family protein [Comamonadaceae bacterium]|nr:nucleotidyltransferase family protein [Comamonadaceae bacterium]
MLLDQLRQMKEPLNTLAHHDGASHLRVFGSVARGEETPQSDADFLVEFTRGYDLFLQRLPLTQQLADLLGRRVDLVPEHELNPHIRQHVLRKAIAL